MNNEEQVKVLQMVADGIVTVEEGEKLLDTLEKTSESESVHSDMPENFPEDSGDYIKQSKADKKREKGYRKYLKRVQKANKKLETHVSGTSHIGEDRLTKAADELAQKAVDKALESIGKKVEDISNSIFE